MWTETGQMQLGLGMLARIATSEAEHDGSRGDGFAAFFAQPHSRLLTHAAAEATEGTPLGLMPNLVAIPPVAGAGLPAGDAAPSGLAATVPEWQAGPPAPQGRNLSECGEAGVGVTVRVPVPQLLAGTTGAKVQTAADQDGKTFGAAPLRGRQSDPGGLLFAVPDVPGLAGTETDIGAVADAGAGTGNVVGPVDRLSLDHGPPEMPSEGPGDRLLATSAAPTQEALASSQTLRSTAKLLSKVVNVDPATKAAERSAVGVVDREVDRLKSPLIAQQPSGAAAAEPSVTASGLPDHTGRAGAEEVHRYAPADALTSDPEAFLGGLAVGRKGTAVQAGPILTASSGGAAPRSALAVEGTEADPASADGNAATATPKTRAATDGPVLGTGPEGPDVAATAPLPPSLPSQPADRTLPIGGAPVLIPVATGAERIWFGRLYWEAGQLSRASGPLDEAVASTRANGAERSDLQNRPGPAPVSIGAAIASEGISVPWADAEVGSLNAERDLAVLASLRAALPGPTGIPAAGPLLAGPDAQLLAGITAAFQHHASGAVEISLSPDELGSVRLRLVADTRDPDRMVVQLAFDRPETMDLFRRHAEQLTEAIRAAGYAEARLDFGHHEPGSEAGSGRDAPDGSNDRGAAVVASETDLDQHAPAPGPALPLRPAHAAGLDLRL